MNVERILLGLALSTAIGGAAYWRGSLTRGGWLGAMVTGTLTFGFGGWAWGLTLIAFFVSSSLLSRFKKRLKEQRTDEKFAKGGQRDFGQAMANGGLGAALAFLVPFVDAPFLLLAAFAGVMATVTADTWATELGTLSQEQPRLITTGKSVPVGTSGGLTRMGTTATIAGACFIGLVLAGVLWLETGIAFWSLILLAAIGGTLGSLCDSLLGATVQVMYTDSDGEETERAFDREGHSHQIRRGLAWMNNDMVNFVSSVIGGLASTGLFVALSPLIAG